MKNALDSKLILRVFEKIRLNGEKKQSEYFLQGIKTYTDFDGYTLFLEDALVQLNLGFHNQYHFEYEKVEHFEQFVKKLEAIDSQF
jgi:hypothetical protein